MNEKPVFAYAMQPTQALDTQHWPQKKKRKKSSSRVGLISAVGRDLQLKANTRLVPRRRMGLQLDDLGWGGRENMSKELPFYECFLFCLLSS